MRIFVTLCSFLLVLGAAGGDCGATRARGASTKMAWTLSHCSSSSSCSLYIAQGGKRRQKQRRGLKMVCRRSSSAVHWSPRLTHTGLEHLRTFASPLPGSLQQRRGSRLALSAPSLFAYGVLGSDELLGNRQVKLNVHVVLPCLNEAHVLPTTLARLCAFLEQQAGWNWSVTVVDNGSTDGTSNVTQTFALAETRVKLMRLEERGRGRALRAAWLGNDADIQSYMDVDLSTDLECLPSLVER